MRKFILLLLLFPGVVCGNNLTLDDALRSTYTACVGIDDELADLKQMAGINTAITAVGSVAAGGATAVGLIKANKDADIRKLEEMIKEIEARKKQPMTKADIEAFNAAFGTEYEKINIDDITSQSEKLEKQSKNLGDWRTGLMAGSTATNVAGAIIAGTNQVRRDIDKAFVNGIDMDVFGRNIAQINPVNLGRYLHILFHSGHGSDVFNVFGDFKDPATIANPQCLHRRRYRQTNRTPTP